MKKGNIKRLAIVFTLPLIFILSQCLNKSKTTDARGDKYAGSAACLKCHSAIYKNYLHTAHYLTSRLASAATIAGSFGADSNTVVFNDSVKLVMEKHKDGLYQVSYLNGKRKQAHRFAITLGSDRGETFFYWKNNKVYQLPASYYLSLHQWQNSPAYSGDSVNFSRVIGRRCFECHSSYIQSFTSVNGTANTDSLDKSSMILSIDCERCHGPCAEHVNFHTANPTEKKPMYITKIGSLSRQQRVDLCSTCHAGNSDVMTRSTFDFKPGDTLANFSSGQRFHSYQDVTKVDVHGNQVKLLTNSKCYMSSKIECATCHQIHDDRVKTSGVYSAYCTSCHSEANHNFCKLAAQIGPAITGNCINCHMPVRSSHSIVINSNKKQLFTPFLARTHLIAIYPEETKKVISWIRSNAAGSH